MEADAPANTKTRERTKGTATAVQAICGDSFSACRVDPSPIINSTSFGMMPELPDVSWRDDVEIESGNTGPKSCLPSLDMRSPTAAGGLDPTGETFTAGEATVNEPFLQFYSTDEENSKKTNLWTSILSAWYDSSFWKMLPASSRSARGLSR